MFVSYTIFYMLRYYLLGGDTAAPSGLSLGFATHF